MAEGETVKPLGDNTGSHPVVKWFKIIILVVMVFYSVYGLIMSILAFVNFSKITGSFNNIVDNWKNELIIDIQAKNIPPSPGVKPTCDTGFEPFLIYKWPGTVDGCDCRTATNTQLPNNKTITKTIFPGTCTSDMTAVTCKGVASTPAATYDNYRNYLYCVKKAKGITYATVSKYMNKDGSCQSGYHLCGGGGVAKADEINGVCVPDATFPSGACPVMDIQKAAVTPGAGYVALGTSGFWVSKSPSISSSVLSEYLMNEGVACKGDVNSITTTGDNHPLTAKNFSRCTTMESNFVVVDSGIDRVSYFADNRNFLTSPVEIDKYVLSSQLMKTFKRNFYGFRPDCRADVNKMIDNQDEVKSIYGAQVGNLIIAVIVAFIVGLIFSYYDLFMLCSNPANPGRVGAQKCIDRKPTIGLVVSLIHIAILIWAVAVSGKIKSYFSDLGERKCGDAETSKNLKDLSGQVNDYVYSKNLQALIITAIKVAVDILMMIFKALCCKNKEEANRGNSSVAPAPISNRNDESKPSPQQNYAPVPVNPGFSAGGPPAGFSGGFGAPAPGYNPQVQAGFQPGFQAGYQQPGFQPGYQQPQFNM